MSQSAIVVATTKVRVPQPAGFCAARLDDQFDVLDDFFRVRLRPQERAAVLRRLAA